MPPQSKYLFTASMDVAPDRETLFNEVYDTEHVPSLMEVPGVVSVARFKTQELTMLIGGERRTVVLDDQPSYSAAYEIESPDVLVTEAWGRAVEAGRWPDQVRPHTTNRRHVLYKLISPAQ